MEYKITLFSAIHFFSSVQFLRILMCEMHYYFFFEIGNNAKILDALSVHNIMQTCESKHYK